MKPAHILYTRTPAGMTYVEPAWWAIDAESGHEVAGPCTTVEAVLREIKGRYTITDEELVEATDAEFHAAYWPDSEERPA